LSAARAREAPLPPAVQWAIDGLVALLASQAVDLSGVALDMGRTPDFDRRVCTIARGS